MPTQQAVILAGGKGTRMRSFSDTPKVLLPLAGKPILVNQLEWLRDAGFSEVFLCLGHSADVIKEALGDGSQFGIRINYHVESEPRGTAGAVKDLGDAITGDLLVVYGDLFVALDCRKLMAFHCAHDGVATVVVRQTDHPEDSDIAEVDQDGRIQAVGRLASGEVSGNLGCAAIWVVRPKLLERVPAAGMSDFSRDIFPAATRAGDKLLAYETSETVMDVGTPARYERFLKLAQNA